MFKFNNKDITAVVLVSLLQKLNIFQTLSKVSIIDLEEVIICGVLPEALSNLQQRNFILSSYYIIFLVDKIEPFLQ